VLDDASLVADAAGRTRALVRTKADSPDFFHGTAGQVLAHLAVFDETGDPADLADAEAAGDQLLANCDGGADESWWVIPEGFEGLAGHAYLGYAHGAAGIGDVLLDLFETTGRDDFLDAASRAVNWLARQADCSGAQRVTWPVTPGGTPSPPFWCHGATGIGKFLLHAAQLSLHPDAEELAVRAALSAAEGARWSSISQCHGLAGAIELLLDVATAFPEAELREQADELGTLMTAFATEGETGVTWTSVAPEQVTPDYLIGYAGLAPCLLRLAFPHWPRQLSRAGFRYRAEMAGGHNERASSRQSAGVRPHAAGV